MGRRYLYTVSLGLLFVACKKNNQEFLLIPDDAPEVLPTRAEVIDDYKNMYLASEMTVNGWTGSTSTCSPGTISQEAMDKGLLRINYFRKLVRLNHNISWDHSLHNKLQQTSLMMQSNRTADHYPSTSWSCYSSAGADGAGESNLGFYSGAHYPVSFAIDGQIEDPGANNYVVGHRRWLLHSKASQFGIGASNAAVTIGVLNAAWKNKDVPNFIAYPAKGYFPKPLVFDRWSFGKPNADFSNATVTMTSSEGNIPLVVTSRSHLGIGDNTIVWEPQGIDLSSSEDIVYTVTVSGIKGAYKDSYTYDVIIINP